MALTVKQLESLSATDKGRKLSDGGSVWGLVKVAKDGSLSVAFYWRFGFGVANKREDFYCGTWRKGVSMTTIRKERDNAAAILASGKNPNEERKLTKERAAVAQQEELAKIEAEKAALRTLGACLSEWYESSEIVNRKDRGAYIKRSIAKHILPKLGGISIQIISKVMLADILHSVAKSAPIMANRLHSMLNQFFKYCANEREWVSRNPLDGTSRAKIGGKESPRERVLCDPKDPAKHELKELRDAMDAAKLIDSTKAVLWIILGTACRIGEITQARWEAVDFVKRTWTIPPENSKNGKAHTVNLSDFALRHFEMLKTYSGTKSPWIFPASRGDGPVCVKSVGKQIYDRQRDVPMKGRSKAVGALRLSNGAWTPHDLRRTAATLMGHCGVLSEIIERCLNHTEENKLKRTYQLQEPRQQMQEAWGLLGQRLEVLLADEKVIAGNFSSVFA